MKYCRLTYIYILAVLTLVLSCKEDNATLFELVDPMYSGIDFNNTLTPTNELNILDYLYYYNGGGVAIGDINNDNLPDIFFTGNQINNKLYLNKGNLEFEDISSKANILGESDWNTGVTMVDINGDNLLDIYVCAVVGINGLNGHNELYINNGDLTFTESAEEYGLNFKNYSTHSSFFDYDNDGDLDLYLLNHAVHTSNSYDGSQIREKRIEETGDKLLRNDGGVYRDVSEYSGIYGGLIGYGLGLCTADFNNDGYTDIYVSNDFHEDDYYYVNNGDGTFSERSKDRFGHISRFSMGSDAADINNDGYYDLITLDMLPAEEKILKASVGEDNIDVHKLKTKKLGFHNQYARNMLQVNQNGKTFQETALYSGVSATDWSWSALFADYDMDGHQDLFITNGIPKRPNDLDYINYISNEEISRKLKESKTLDKSILEKMPYGESQNCIFKGDKTLKFADNTKDWLPKKKSVSNGSAYADLDGDGDLDLVSNNTNGKAYIYKNNQNTKNHYLKIKLQGDNNNSCGIGSKIVIYHQDVIQIKQLYTSKGFQSSSEPLVYFGLGKTISIDSLSITWPDNTRQVLKKPPIDTLITLKKSNAVLQKRKRAKKSKLKRLFTKIDGNKGIDFKHIENNYIDFKKVRLLPYMTSDRTKAMIIGDINYDGTDDVIFGGSKTYPTTIYLQNTNGIFNKVIDSIAVVDKRCEDIDGLLIDIDNSQNLIMVSGGGEYSNKSIPLLDRIYYNTGNGQFEKGDEIPQMFINSTVIKSADIDQDGDIDLFIGGRQAVNNFGDPSPTSYLLENTDGQFQVKKNSDIERIGMTTDALFTDFDNDGDKDLIVVGEWMSPQFLENDQNNFSLVSKMDNEESGLWQRIEPYDIDKDGDMDYLLGNWGLNSKFKASEKYPMLLYYGDFDDNGNSENIVAIEKDGDYFTTNTFEELASQLPFLKKKFTTHTAAAGKTITELFDKSTLQKMHQLKVNQLASGYLENNNGRFTFRPYDEKLQLSTITNILLHDFDGNGVEDVMLAGNYFGVTPYHGRLDGLDGAVLFDDGTLITGTELGINLSNKQVAKIDILKINKEDYLIVMNNNDKAELYKISK